MPEAGNNIVYSLVVLTYQRPRLLRNCLESISRQDTHKGQLEVIVVDDGSSDDNKPIIEDFKGRLEITYVKQRHRGISAARNSGIKSARGSFIAIIADDYYLPRDYLSKVSSFFNNHPDAQVVRFNIRSCGHSWFRHVQQLYMQLVFWQAIREGAEPGGAVKSYELPASGAAVFRKELFLRVGVFNENLQGGEDVEFTMRLRKQAIAVYFFPDFYIEHWEANTILSLLRQRYRYGGYFFYSLKKSGQKCDYADKPFYDILKAIFNKYLEFWSLSRKIDRHGRYILFSPFIFLFLSLFYLGLYMESKRIS